MLTHFLSSLHKTVLPLIALIAFAFAVYRVRGQQDEQPAEPPFNAPAESPYDKVVAGSGIVEPRTEDIFVGTAVPGLVLEVFVQVGDAVKPGDKLFRIDDRSLQADLGVRRAELASATASLTRLRNMPRAEQVAPSEHKIAEAKARLVESEDRYKRAARLRQTGTVPEEELIQARQAFVSAKELLGIAEAEHTLLLAGAWEQDIHIAEAAVAEAQAQVDKIQMELDRLEVRAPEYMNVQSFEVLQVKVRPGEYVGAPPTETLVVLGNLDRLHVRVDIDEHDIPRFSSRAKAVAKLRGSPDSEFPLRFVRLEPYVVPKRSLTGDNTERVDTRVLQVIYELEPGEQPLFVGQQMDVFIESKL